MDIIEIDKIDKYLRYSIFIGKGDYARCFLMPNKKVLKLYYYPKRADLLSNFIDISEVHNDTYHVPELLLIKNNHIIGYIYEYVEGYTIHKFNRSLKLEYILKPYDKLVIDTRKISDNSLRLCDVHNQNILFNDYYNVIDLDASYKEDRISKENLFKMNLGAINKSIIYSIFKVNPDEILEFSEEKLNSLYNKAISGEEEDFREFFNNLGNTNSIRKVKRKNDYVKKINTYY